MFQVLVVVLQIFEPFLYLREGSLHVRINFIVVRANLIPDLNLLPLRGCILDPKLPKDPEFRLRSSQQTLLSSRIFSDLGVPDSEMAVFDCDGMLVSDQGYICCPWASCHLSDG